MKNTVRHLTIITLPVMLLIFAGSLCNEVFAVTPQSLYDDVWKLVNQKYVDQSENGQDWNSWRHKYDKALKTEEDAFVAIDTMLASLDDRYTRFLNPDEFKEENDSIRAKLYGVGMQIGSRDNKLLIIAPLESTPAERAGLKANDEIISIDGQSTKGLSVKEAADKIKGEKGTKVKLLIRRNNLDKLYEIVRDEIQIKSVSTKTPFNNSVPSNIAYIRLNSFLSKDASSEIRSLIINNKNKEGLIIDIRSNPGGLLSNAVTISDYFLDDGAIVSTVDRDSYKEIKSADSFLLWKKPVILLIDGGSASASEIFSGALKDHHRAILVGSNTFGKGLVQEINHLQGGSGINITTQKYLTPNDVDINKKGIAPDIEVKNTEKDFQKKFDKQLSVAIKALKQLIAGKSMNTVINSSAELISEK